MSYTEKTSHLISRSTVVEGGENKNPQAGNSCRTILEKEFKDLLFSDQNNVIHLTSTW